MLNISESLDMIYRAAPFNVDIGPRLENIETWENRGVQVSITLRWRSYHLESIRQPYYYKNKTTKLPDAQREMG